MTLTEEIKIVINKRSDRVPEAELQHLSKEDLIEKVIQLQSHNFQLRNLLRKKIEEECGPKESKSQSVSKEQPTTAKHQKKLDSLKNAPRRHILLKLLYFGWDYNGFASQENSGATIEEHLFRALTRTCLIESRQSANYHRCGRTDKGVSAFSQVISLNVRSKFPKTEQLNEENISKEIDYCTILNGVLPKNIQCLSWMPLKNPSYSARFDCVQRTYRYFFPKGNLNIEAMRKGCKHLIGSKDFRNLCKMDVHNGVTKFIRHVKSADVLPCQDQSLTLNSGFNMFYFEITANAFLWHQIRCILAVLLLIGQEKEEPSVLEDLLNVEKNPCKPQYTPALGLPLNLYDCQFRKKSSEAKEYVEDTGQEEDSNPDTTEWVFSESNMIKVVETLQGEWAENSMKATMVREVLHSLETMSGVKSETQYNIVHEESTRKRGYQKLLTRKRCESLDNRIDHFIKKKRITVAQS
ncbi:PUS3 family protein [Megaselia abdita]